MNQQNQHEYYTARAAVSRDLAHRAVSPAIAALHAEFAARYEQGAAEVTGNDEIALMAVQPG